MDEFARSYKLMPNIERNVLISVILLLKFDFILVISALVSAAYVAIGNIEHMLYKHVLLMYLFLHITFRKQPDRCLSK